MTGDGSRVAPRALIVACGLLVALALPSGAAASERAVSPDSGATAGFAPLRSVAAPCASAASTSQSHAHHGAIARRVRHGRQRGGRERGPPRRQLRGRRRARRDGAARLASRTFSRLGRFALDHLSAGRHLRAPTRRADRPRAARRGRRRRAAGRSRARGRRARRRRRSGRRPRSRRGADPEAPRARTRSPHPASSARAPSRPHGRRPPRSPLTRSRIDPRVDLGAVSRPGLQPTFQGGVG